jgi:type II secretion system protein N
VTPRIRRLLMYVGYPAFYVACLMVFAYVSAPWDRLKQAVTEGFNTASPLRLEMDSMSWSWRFPGVSASGVRFVAPESELDPTGKTKPPAEYNVDDFYARVSVLPLLWGTSKLGFALDGFGGSVDGTVKTASDERVVEVELDKVDASKLPYLADVLGIPLGGTVKGEISLELPEQKLAKANGHIELEIENFEIGDGKTKIRDTIALPKIQAGTFSLKAEVAEGVVKITEFSTKGPDLEVVAEGRIRLQDRLESSLAELNARYKFSDVYRNKDDTTRGLFGAPGASVPGLFDLDPKMKRAKREDGFYVWHVTGPLSRLTFNPGSGSGSGSTEPGAARTRRPALRARPKAGAAAPPPLVTPPPVIPPPPDPGSVPPTPEPLPPEPQVVQPPPAPAEVPPPPEQPAPEAPPPAGGAAPEE